MANSCPSEPAEIDPQQPVSAAKNRLHSDDGEGGMLIHLFNRDLTVDVCAS